MEGCVEVELHSLEKYLSTSKEKILKEVSRNGIIETINMKEVKKKYIKRMEKGMKENVLENIL